MDEDSLRARFETMAGMRYYFVIRIQAERRIKGEDPKFADKREFSMEIGGIATDLEDQRKKAEASLEFILTKEAEVLAIKNLDHPETAIKEET